MYHYKRDDATVICSSVVTHKSKVEKMNHDIQDTSNLPNFSLVEVGVYEPLHEPN
jgi:hypothetical protein